MNMNALADLGRSVLMIVGGLLVAQGVTDSGTISMATGALAMLASGGLSLAKEQGAVSDLGRSLVLMVGGVLVQRGYVDKETVAQAAGGVAALVGVIWTATHHGVKPDPAKTSAIAVLGLGLLFLGGCNTTGTGIGKLATDKNLANVEAGLSGANALAQSLIANGTIPAKDAPKVQAAIDAAAFAVAQAKQALADGKLDAADAITVAFAAAAQVPVIIAEYKSGKP